VILHAGITLRHPKRLKSLFYQPLIALSDSSEFTAVSRGQIAPLNDEPCPYDSEMGVQMGV
jgi:hypothetical protein